MVHRNVEFVDAWDLEEVYGALFDLARGYPWQPDREDQAGRRANDSSISPAAATPSGPATFATSTRRCGGWPRSRRAGASPARAWTRRSSGCAMPGGATMGRQGKSGGRGPGRPGRRAGSLRRVQLEEVLRVCRSARSLSDAGRMLFAVSRTRKASSNDADRLRKYLARYGLTWKDVATGGEP